MPGLFSTRAPPKVNLRHSKKDMKPLFKFLMKRVNLGICMKRSVFRYVYTRSWPLKIGVYRIGAYSESMVCGVSYSRLYHMVFGTINRLMNSHPCWSSFQLLGMMPGLSPAELPQFDLPLPCAILRRDINVSSASTWKPGPPTFFGIVKSQALS